MKVSLCMIVKDEEKHLETCLESAQDLVQEIVIVDTGSSDRTPEIAQKWADTYDEILWNGMSDARNHSIGLATGDVILVLDADEEVIEKSGWEDALSALKDGADAVAFILYNALPESQILKGDRLWQIRMWHNRPEARFVGKVHNQISPSLKENPLDGKEARFAQVNMQIFHKGYNLTPEERKEKYEARLEDLKWEKENAEGNLKAYYTFQLCNSYFMIGEKGKSLQEARECELEKLTEENRYSLCLMGTHACHALGLKEEALEWARKMMEVSPQEAMSFFMMGVTLMGMEKWQGAYNFLGSSMALVELKGVPYKYLLDPHFIAAPAGECALALKRLGEAKELFQMHLSQHSTPRIAQLEKAIVPIEEARKKGLVDEEGSEAPVEQESGTTEIHDLRKTG